MSSRIPQNLSTAANPGSTTASPSHIPPNVQVSLGGEHVLTHSRSSSNLGGDDGERDVDWEDEGIGMSLGGGQEDWDAQLSRFNFGAGSGLNTPGPGFSFSPFGTVPGGDDWRRWAEGEIIKERKRVEKLVGVVKALVDSNAKGGMTASMDLDQESNGSKFGLFSVLS